MLNRALDAQSLLRENMRHVSEFGEGAPQSDDLTVIVISVRQKRSLGVVEEYQERCY